MAIHRSSAGQPRQCVPCFESRGRTGLPWDVREREHLLSASLTVKTTDEIKQLFLTYEAADVRFHQTLKTQPWGAGTFIVEDPDGNLILFAGA